MELELYQISWTATEYQLAEALATALHSEEFNEFVQPGDKLNFAFSVNTKRRTERRQGGTALTHTGDGLLTIANLPAARFFFARYGPEVPASQAIYLNGVRLLFRRSMREPAQALLADLTAKPWRDPHHLIELHNREDIIKNSQIRVVEVQFGWICRDGTFSIEHTSALWASLIFEHRPRQIVFRPQDLNASEWVAMVMRYRSVVSATLPATAESCPSILLELNVAPSFEQEGKAHWNRSRKGVERVRVFLPISDMRRAARYITRAVRVVVADEEDMRTFSQLVDLEGLPVSESRDYRFEQRELFSFARLDAVDSWMRTLQHQVGVQLERLLCERLVDPTELLELRPVVEQLLAEVGESQAAVALSAFAIHLKTVPRQMAALTSLPHALRSQQSSLGHPQLDPILANPQTDRVEVLHVALAPSSVTISGPHTEPGNRILRQFVGFEDHFIRIAFVDDDGQTFRYDPGVDIEPLVSAHILPVMTSGFMLSGRCHEYLAYSQSALKQHTFWFVRPFKDANGQFHTADTIRAGMGDFSKDERCPPRVAARMSLAFSATTATSTLLPGERVQQPDIGGKGNACMTDGAGIMSVESADVIWQALCQRQGLRDLPPCPSVFQIRLGGDKGTLMRDHSLGPGRRIVVRDSMVKFAANERFDQVEVCTAFTKPGAAFLNRPLIMILEARGVSLETFLRLQQNIIEQTERATTNLDSAAALLEMNGLGMAFQLPALFKQLGRRMVNSPSAAQAFLQLPFVKRLLGLSVNHVLRGLKFRGRIPIPDSWNLVGVPDIHGVLKEGEIFACVREGPLDPPRYVEGKVLVTRSPTCHPGDAMKMTAIGRPPSGSVYETHTPENCVLFSTAGKRSPASCLGGGDYDGDEYLISTIRELRPPLRAKPADPSAPIEPGQPVGPIDIGRRYTMNDIHSFAANFVIQDQLGRIASAWLKIADKSDRGVYDVDCMELSKLHSSKSTGHKGWRERATQAKTNFQFYCDYPKTGRPTTPPTIPRGPSTNPDWSISELGAADDRGVYPSQKALGHLFRAINLPSEEELRESLGIDETDESPSDGRRNSLHNAPEIAIALRRGDGIVSRNPLTTFLSQRLMHLAPEVLVAQISNDAITSLVYIFNRYSTSLRAVCQHNTLSRSQRAQLLEEEVVAGTILARTANYRQRENHMKRMAEQSERLRQDVVKELTALAEVGNTKMSTEVARQSRVETAWLAWRVALVVDGFGASSFEFVALSMLLSAFDEIEAAI